MEAGQVLDRYKLVRKAGSGGMAEVWEAFDEGLDRTVAIKVMSGDTSHDSEYVRRFFREAKIVARMDHPNILPVYDVGEVDGRPYLVMPFVANGTLKDRMQQMVPPEDALRWLGEAAAGLDHAHKSGILHRDIKPANLLFGKSGALCLADFGLARTSEQSHAITVPGVVMGTPSYISPDQIISDDVTAAADQYSLAVVAFELLTGKLPFTAPSSFLLLNKHVSQTPTKATEARGDLPSGVDAVFEKALAKKPEARFPSCTAFVNALSDALQPETKKLSRPNILSEDGEGGTVRLDILSKPGPPAEPPRPAEPRPAEPSRPTVATTPYPRPEPAPESGPRSRPLQRPAAPVRPAAEAPVESSSGSRLPWVLVVLLLAFIGGAFLWLRERPGASFLFPGAVSPSPAPAVTAGPLAVPTGPPLAGGEPATGAEPSVAVSRPGPETPSTASLEPPAKIIELAPETPVATPAAALPAATALPTAMAALPTATAEAKPAAAGINIRPPFALGQKDLETFHISAVRQTRVVNGQSTLSTSWKITLVFRTALAGSPPEPEVVSASLSGPGGKKPLFPPGTKGKVLSGEAGQREVALFFDGEQALTALEAGFDTVDFKIRLDKAELPLTGELRSR